MSPAQESTRTTRAARRIAGLAGAAACASAMAPLAAPTAYAANATGQQNYNCIVTVDENPGEPGSVDLTASLQLDLPDRVEPGQSFSVSGTFSVQLSGEMGALFSAYFPTAQVISDGLKIPANIGGQDVLIGTSRLDSGNQSTSSQPMVLSGPVNSDPIDVPQDASGEVTFSMPRNDSVDAISRGGRAAFTATLIAQGGLVPGYDKGTDRVSCDSPSGESVPIGSVPIAVPEGAPAPGASPQSGNDGGGAAPAGGSSASRSSSGGAAATAAGQSSGAAAKDNKPASALETAQAADGGAPQAAAGEPANVTSGNSSLLANGRSAGQPDPGSGFYIPLEGLAWGTGIIVGASLLFTWWSGLRLRRLKDFADEYGRD